MGSRVKEILSWYDGDNPGTRANLARIMNHGRLAGTGRFVILPVDQGFEHGPARSFAVNPAGYDPTYHFQLAIDAGCNAYAAPLGFLEAGAAEFAGDIPLILKMNNHDVLNDEKDPLSSVTGSVKDALRLGCVAAGFTIYPGSAHAQTMYEQCREMIAECKANALPPWSGRTRGARPSARRGRRASMWSPTRPRSAPARSAHYQGQAADPAHRAGGGQEGLREGRRCPSPPWPSVSATSCSPPHLFGGRHQRKRGGALRRVPRHPGRRRVRLHHRAELLPAREATRPRVPQHGDEDLFRRAQVARPWLPLRPRRRCASTCAPYPTGGAGVRTTSSAPSISSLRPSVRPPRAS